MPLYCTKPRSHPKSFSTPMPQVGPFRVKGVCCTTFHEKPAQLQPPRPYSKMSGVTKNPRRAISEIVHLFSRSLNCAKLFVRTTQHWSCREAVSNRLRI